jgi:beta-lactamase superfamily II metal-dependent hydrolase
MRGTSLFLVTVVLFLPILLLHAQAPPQKPAGQKSLDIYFIDTEGGQATLFVPSSGETLLMDTGSGGDGNKQADRISAAIKEAGVQQLDYVIVSHYHADHVGNAAELANRLPIRHFIDHGPYTVELQPSRSTAFVSYLQVRQKAHVSVPKPGEEIPIVGLDVEVVSSAGELLKTPLPGVPGSGALNPACREFTPKDQDPTPENYESVGIVVRFGKFRLLDLADLTWNQENELVCPNNLLGTFDVYHTTRHGTEWSGSPELVHGARARVAVMNNGPKKGGTPEAWTIIHSTPGFQDLWQLHYSELVDKDHNPPDDFIANLNETDHGYALKMSVRSDGRFAIKNERNGFTKEYH